ACCPPYRRLRLSEASFVVLINSEQGTAFVENSTTRGAASLWTCRFAWTTQARCPHAHSYNKNNSRQLIEIGLEITHTTARRSRFLRNYISIFIPSLI